MQIKSLLSLPQPVVKFSHVNLPGTNILIKCGLSNKYISYWRMLNKLTVVNQKILEKDEDDDKEEDEEYLKEVTEYLPSEDADFTYAEYLDTVVPKQESYLTSQKIILTVNYHFMLYWIHWNHL